MFAGKSFNGSNCLISSDKWFIHPSGFLHLSFSFSALPTQMFVGKGFNGSNCLIVSDKWFIHPSGFPSYGSIIGRGGAPQLVDSESLLADSQ
ncbi:MAG: hypothetical protein K2N13_10115 [Paraprevotella sp.]|nr:hypothetical protein [Paraprevotella sp.]